MSIQWYLKAFFKPKVVIRMKSVPTVESHLFSTYFHISGSVHPMVTVTPSPLAGPLQPSSVRSTDSSPSHSHSHSHSQMSRNSSRKSNNSVNCKLDSKYETLLQHSFHFFTLMEKNKIKNCFTADLKLLPRKYSYLDPLTLKVPLKDVVCYLSLLEAGRPEDKLECKYIFIFIFQLHKEVANTKCEQKKTTFYYPTI